MVIAVAAANTSVDVRWSQKFLYPLSGMLAILD